jgi:uncharacterized Ntn-hydrolase superfamily protein
MTFSIVARCAKTGQAGVAIATYSPNVGARCPVVVPGAAATVQAVASPALLRLAASMLEQGFAARQVVAALLAAEPRPEFRQIAVVDREGGAHAVTGERNPAWAGHRVGEGYACSGNVLAGAGVVDAMAAAFEASADCVLAERLVRAVEAGRDAGGQPEGQNSAALVVYDRFPFPIVDQRVDLHDEPERELRRLWDWFAPMVPYYIERALTPEVPRWWQWRQEHVPGWGPRHLR